MAQKLYKSRTNRKISGVCGGIGEYFNIDPTIVRLGFVVGFLCAGVGLIPYLIAMIVIPEEV